MKYLFSCLKNTKQNLNMINQTSYKSTSFVSRTVAMETKEMLYCI